MAGVFWETGLGQPHGRICSLEQLCRVGCSSRGAAVILGVTERVLENPGHLLLGFSPLLWELDVARLI